MSGRVIELEALCAERALWLPDTRVVLTNGVFDLLHVGHLRYLREAKRLGDVLIVGVNADSAVGKPGRPVVPAEERAELVAALQPVDFAAIFAERTADGLLRALRPHVYVKGADYSEATLPEAVSAHAVGAELAFIPLVPGRSTSQLLERLRFYVPAPRNIVS